jgi:hypothetical protein
MGDEEAIRDAVAIMVFQALVSHTHTPGDVANNVEKMSNVAFFCANQFMETRLKYPYIPTAK